MWSDLQHFFDDSMLSPHGMCLLWRPELIRLHVVSDTIIALAYFSISFALGVFAYKRPDIQYSWVFWSFAAFILACGLTHVMSIWTLWVPDYGLEGLVKATTACASIVSAIALWPLMPRVLGYPTPDQYRRVGEALHEAERQLRMLVDGVTDYAIFMLDPEGRVTDWNAGAQRILGYSREEILGRHFSILYTDEARASGVPQHALAAAAKRGRYENEAPHLRKDGTLFWASFVLNAIQGPDGQVVGFAKITQDITERRDAEERLRVSREQLFQSQKMEAVGQLTGGVAHDFNNLLMIVLGNIEIAQRFAGAQSEAGRLRLDRALNHASTGASRAATLTQRLLAFSRRQPLAPKPIEIRQLLQSVEDLLRGSLPETIDIKVAQGDEVWQVEADPTHLESALINLALNARDAMPEGGKLTIETCNAVLDENYCRRHVDVQPGQYLCIAVSDTGHGMTGEVIARAFEPFFTTKPQGQGTGLGLSQVYGFVKQSGGHLHLYSEPQLGATIRIYLPRLMTEPPTEPPALPEVTASGHGRETILVVEDDPHVRAYLVETLTDLGYGVREAGSAEAACAAVDHWVDDPPDLLLTDIVLPGMNGRSLADALTARLPKLKVLYMSGYARNAIVHQGRLDPGIALLQKPVTTTVLAKGIRIRLDS